ncbi:MAG: hypothetical protein ABIC40_07605 [bacterium]
MKKMDGGKFGIKHFPIFIAVLLLIVVSPAASGQAPNTIPSWTDSGSMAEGGSWEAKITASSRSFEPGDMITVSVDFTIRSLGLAYNINRINGIYTLVTGSREFNETGDMTGGSHMMGSTILTGTGLPIKGEISGLPTDRFGGPFRNPIDSFIVTAPPMLDVDLKNGTIHGTVLHTISLADDTPKGWYRIRADIGLEITENSRITLWGIDPTLPTTGYDKQTFADTGLISVGTSNQPRMIWSLFSGILSNGGVVAVEDRGYVAVDRGDGFSSLTVLPMTNEDGMQIRYLIEPDFPFLKNPFMKAASPSSELNYHSGWMEARIEDPGGVIIDLGGASFAGARGLGATTMSDRFTYSFSSYGLFKIELKGWIKGSDDQVYTGGGVYEVYIANPLEIKPDILPGTPFKPDDYIDTGFKVYPPFPVDARVTWSIDPNSKGTCDTGAFDIRTNRWGYYSPPIIETRNRFSRAQILQFTKSGEYKITWTASYKEKDGTLWIGEKTIIGVVFPKDKIILSSRPPSSDSFSITSDARYFPVPSDSGDSIHLPLTDSNNIPTIFTFPMGFFPESVTGFRTDDTALQPVNADVAGIFVTPRLASSNGLFPQNYPETIDRKAYLIDTTVRSDGSVRTDVREGAENAHIPYPVYPWLPGEIPADADGDIYHFWSAMVYRDMLNDSTRYGYYSGGAVLDSSVTVAKLHELGTPLTTDGWGAHNLLLHNVAVAPGAIMSKGFLFTSAGYYLPLDPETVLEFTVTAPGGQPKTIKVKCGDSGYACNMLNRFNFDQTGVWLAQARIVLNDQEGGIRGVNTGQPYEFYVIDDDNKYPIRFHIGWKTPMETGNDIVVLTGDLLDSGFTQGKVNISVTFNGAVIEQTHRTMENSAFVYSIDLGQIGFSLPNYDPNDPNDRLDMTFFAEGLDKSGRRRLAAQAVQIKNRTIYAYEKDYGQINPLTREQRMRELKEIADKQLAEEIRGRE